MKAWAPNVEKPKRKLLTRVGRRVKEVNTLQSMRPINGEMTAHGE